MVPLRSVYVGVLYLEQHPYHFLGSQRSGSEEGGQAAPHEAGMSLEGLVGYRGDSEISDSEDERSPHGDQPPGVGKPMSSFSVYLYELGFFPHVLILQCRLDWEYPTSNQNSVALRFSSDPLSKQLPKSVPGN